MPLPGEHQAINCSVALSMIDQLKTRGFEIDDQKAIEGLSSVQLRGRMEIIRDEPRILVDGAHKRGKRGSTHASNWADGSVRLDGSDFCLPEGQGRCRHAPACATWSGQDHFSRVQAQLALQIPRSCCICSQEISGKMAQVAYNLEEAVEIARSACTREDLICITGSFYVVGAATRLFGNGAE